jgi:HK97 family phage prohead protease
MAKTETAPLNYDFGLTGGSVRDAGDKLVVTGRASTWDLDRESDVMARTAFDRSLKRYLSTNPIVLYSHRWSLPLGRTTEARVADDGLHVTVELPRPEPGTEAANMWRLVKAGVIKALSVGGRPTRKVINGVKTIVDWDLRELSICPAGINPAALFSLSSQVGKAFSDEPDALAVARYNAALANRAAESAYLIGARLAAMDRRSQREAR